MGASLDPTPFPLPHKSLLHCWDQSLAAGVGGLGEGAGESVLLEDELPTASYAALIGLPLSWGSPPVPGLLLITLCLSLTRTLQTPTA